MTEKLNEVLDELGQAFEAHKANVAETLKAATEDRGKLSELLEKQERIDEALDTLIDVRDRVSKLEAKSKVPHRDVLGSDHVPDALYDHEDAFDAWLRNPKDPDTIRGLKAAEAEAAKSILMLPARLQRRYKAKGWLDFNKISEPDRERAITITTTGGGNAIPTLIHDRIVEKIYEMSPMRQLANVAMASNENHRFLVVDNDAVGGWAAAGGTRSETGTPSFQAVTLSYGTAYAYPFVYEEAMNDLAMDVGAFVERTSATVLASQEGTAFITGNGSSRPTGVLNGNAVSPLTVVSTADDASPERAFGNIQYLPTGAAAGFQSDYFPGAESPEQDPTAVFSNTVYALRKAYRANAVWLANKATLNVVRKMRDVDGRMLWQPALAAGQPDTLFGYRVEEDENMPDIAANAVPMALADWNEAYQIADLIGTLRITIDDNITAPGNVKFYIRRRLGGNLLNDDAIKVIKCAAS